MKGQRNMQDSLMNNPNKILSYFKRERGTLFIVAISGIFYNIGMIAAPWFEGKMAQYLCDILRKNRVFQDMVFLVLFYFLTILAVQTMRYIKRLSVRKFANHINRDMKQILYRSLVQKKKRELEQENIGVIMTKAIADVDTCAEGMRKFTTEIFDTGVVMAAYLAMLFYYDWRLALLSSLFPPIAYRIAEKLKKIVARSAATYKESAGKLNSATMDRIGNSMMYRVYGQEKNQNIQYETYLKDYEQKAVRANLWETSMQPIYQMISMTSTIFILWFGSKNVLGTGWSNWDIAAFTTFFTCFTKLAVKSSKSAKLFNAVQKAKVSWKRIRPFMENIKISEERKCEQSKNLEVKDFSFAYPESPELFHNVNFYAKKGEIIGVTGVIASGKSTFGKAFLCEYQYGGSIRFGTEELAGLVEEGKSIIAYMGHQPELLSDTIKENILLGKQDEVRKYLEAVCMEQEVSEMPEGIYTFIGNGGVRLSGGQQARIALARTLCHQKPIMILDDPFSAVDQKTEREIFQKIRKLTKDSIVLILSHRLTLFPEMDQVFWIEDGAIKVSNHRELMEQNKNYANLYQIQTKEGVKHE